MTLIFRDRVWFFAIMIGVLLAMAAIVLAKEANPAGSQRLPLIPIISTAADGPEFNLDHTNDTDEAIDIPNLLSASSIVLDDKVYPCVVVKFGGRASLDRGQKKSFRVSLSAYLPKSEKKGYSEVLKRWRWKVPLKSGRHTLLVKFGTNEYGPITFIWDGDHPLLYE